MAQDGPISLFRAKQKSNIYLKPIKGPASELEPACLLVEGEVSNVDITRGLEYGGGLPLDEARGVERGFGHGGYMVVTVRAATETAHKYYTRYIYSFYRREEGH